jgi:hypothetical protein
VLCVCGPGCSSCVTGAGCRTRSSEFREAERQAGEIREALATVRQETRDAAAEAAKPKVAQTCPFCGATTIPDANGRCEYCGGAMGV